MNQIYCRDVDKSEFGIRLSIFHYCSWWIFLQYLPDYLNIHETIPGLYRGPPQDKGWDEDEQTKNESKSDKKSVRPEKNK